MKPSALLLRLAVLALACASTAPAATVNVNSLTGLQTAINNANPGDLIMVADGTYTGSTPVAIAKAGTSTAHITIAAETIGGVTIGGTAAFQFTSPAAYIDVEGFVFTHSNAISIPAGTHHIRLTRNVIQLAIAAGADVSYINIAGDDVQIDYNELRNKSTLGEMLDISGSGTQVARRLWVHHNYFHDFTNPGDNGAETIRWGLSGLSLSTGDGLCEYNLFMRCNGENEMISNKSSGNTYRYNTVLDCPGGEISQRHGNFCSYYGNYMRNTQGMRIYGDNHLIHSNYLEGNSIGINMGNGDGEVETGALLTSHDKPDDCTVVFNTLINNTVGYQMGGRTGGLGADGITFANNIIQGGTTAVIVSTTAPYSNPVWSGNIIWNATTIGDIPAGGYSSVDPLLGTDADGVYHLQAGSPAIGTATGAYTGVTADQDGQTRPGTGLDKGADEFSSGLVTAKLLTTSDVGPNAGGPAAAPTFSPAPGTYTGSQTVAISSATTGASIRYTTDGSTPTSTSGTLYSGPITLSANATLKAIAYKPLKGDSSVTSGTYNIRAAAPTFAPAAGTYLGAQAVTITTATSGASIRYTLDGSTPSSTAGTLYSGPVTIGSSLTLKAIAYKTGLTNSTVTSGAYTIGTTVTSADGFVNRTLGSSQNGVFTVQFDASVSLSSSNTNFSLCQGSQTAYTGLACMVRFNTTGTIDARNGGAFAAVNSVPFSANTTYHIRMDVNVAAHTYSVSVTAPGGSPVRIASDYAFRTEQAGATALDTFNVNVNAAPGGAAAYSATSLNAAAKLTIPAASVTDSGNDGNLPTNTVDGSLATRWSSSGDGQWIRYDLGAVKNVSVVKVAVYSGDTRSGIFDLQTSNDGTNFTTVKSCTSSGTTLALETFEMPDTSARYVRLLGHGNTSNAWNSLTETEVWGF
jgi:hypothetical protein